MNNKIARIGSITFNDIKRINHINFSNGNSDEPDLDTDLVLFKVPDSAFHVVNDDLVYIDSRPLARAINKSITENILSKNGVRRWRMILFQMKKQGYQG